MKKKKVLNKKRSPRLEEIEKRRLWIIIGAIILLFCVVFIKFYQVMILDHTKYKKQLEELSYDTVEGPSAPRGRIYDRNYNILVDNIAVKTIYYQKDKSLSTKDEIKLAYQVSPHLNLDISKLEDRNKREFYIEVHPKIASKKITKKEWEKLDQRKLTSNDIKEMKIKRITDEELNSMSEEDNRAAYL